MRKTYFILAGTVLGLAFNLNAQTATLGSFNSIGMPVQSIGSVPATPDSIVAVTAEAQGLSLVALSDLPPCGTFWLITSNGVMAPMPCPLLDQNLPTYAIADNIFLVDGTGGQVAVNPRLNRQMSMDASTASAVDSLANAVVNLINQVQVAQASQQMQMMSRAMGVPMPGGGGGSGGDATNNNYVAYTWDTNQLWLSISNVSNGTTYANLHNATNLGGVYAIWSTTNLLTPFSGWQVETELFPTVDQTNVLPFTVQNLGRQDLFLRAEDWTGVDSDGDGIPDWWIWKYFGDLAETATNLDSQGNTLGDDYANGVDPNVIQFTIEAANDYVNIPFANLQLNLMAGKPSFYTLLVKGQTTTNWLPFTDTNLTVTLGATDGVYNVTVGLRGLPADATQTWADYSFTLDRVAPKVNITNLASLSGSRPFIDPAGYSTKALSSLAFDVTDADGTITHDQATVTDQGCNPADMNHTTNRFVCLDVALTLGTNCIAISAVDWAGNVTTTNFSCVFDTNGDTTPPAVALTWPQDGMEVSGNVFTLRGMLDDDTATVAGQYTDTNGVTNIVSGLVERGGQFWLQNLPLNPGTNLFTVTATDAAGNVTTTNLSLIQSGVTLAMDAVDASQLNQVQVNVTGEISDPTYAVWVNGVQGTNNGDGTWSANNVPVTSGGTASFDVTGYPPAYAPSGNSWTNFASELSAYPNPFPADPAQVHVDWDKPPVVYVRETQYTNTENLADEDGGSYMITNTLDWTQGGGGDRNCVCQHLNSDGSVADTLFAYNQWPADAGLVPVLPGIGSWYDEGNGWSCTYYTNQNIGLPEFEQVGMGSTSKMFYNADMVPMETWAYVSAQVVELFTGGKAVRQTKSLFVLDEALTWEDWFENYEYGVYEVPMGTVPPQQIALGAYGNLDADGTLAMTAANGQNVVITPKAPGKWKGGALPGKQKYSLASYTWYPALTNTNRDRTTVGVGEQVNLFGMPANSVWNVSAGGLITNANGNIVFTAPSNAPAGGTTAKVTATYKTASQAILFTVVEPSGIDHAKIIGTNSYPLATAGAGMTNAVWIAPTSVSFYRVNIMEVGEDATNISGYFTNWTPQQLHHKTADFWFPLTSNNEWLDWASHSAYLPPWFTGEFTWEIPAKWQVNGSGVTNSMTGWNQKALIDASGTMTVQKFGNSLSRTTNNVITTN